MEESSISDDLNHTSEKWKDENSSFAIDYDPMIISNTPILHPLSNQSINSNISSSNSNIPHQKLSFSKCSSTYSSISINTLASFNSNPNDYDYFNCHSSQNISSNHSHTNSSCNILNDSLYLENNNNNNGQPCHTNINTHINNSHINNSHINNSHINNSHINNPIINNLNIKNPNINNPNVNVSMNNSCINNTNIDNINKINQRSSNKDNESRRKYMKIKNIINDDKVHCNFHSDYSPTITKIKNIPKHPNKRKLSTTSSFNSKKISFKNFLGSNHTYAINNNRSYITLKNSRKRVKIK